MSRILARVDPGLRQLRVATLSLLALAASEVGSLLVRHADLGDALFVLAVSGSIWIRRFGPGFARAGTLVALPFVTLLVAPAVPGAARAQPPPAPPEQAVALVSGGAVWFDEGPVFFEPFGSGKMRLGPAGTRIPTREAESSADAVIVGHGQRASAEGDDPRLLVSEPPGAFESLRYPPLFAGGGCKGWEPSGAHVVIDDELVAAGQCFWDDRFSRQPLFTRSLRAGLWHVLRWLPGENEPVLAAEGPLLAIGAQHSPARMTVSILNLRSDRVQARLTLPDGRLSFASPDRLVDFFPVLRAPGEVCFPLFQAEGCEHRIALYSTGGRRIADLGTAEQRPLVSDMHLLTEEDHEGPPGDGEYLSVRDLAGGRSRGAPDSAPRLVIGFESPARTLDALAFRWPALAVVESTGIPRLPSEIGCWDSEYKPGTPSLRIFDLARNEPPLPPPAIVHVQSSEPLANCGAPPP